jgi:hypothetical protein
MVLSIPRNLLSLKILSQMVLLDSGEGKGEHWKFKGAVFFWCDKITKMLDCDVYL